MINVSSVFLDQAGVDEARAGLDSLRDKADALRKQYESDPKRVETEIGKLIEALPPRKPAPFTRAVDHIERVIKLAGADAVGLGTDFDGIPDPPEGLGRIKLPRITEGCAARPLGGGSAQGAGRELPPLLRAGRGVALLHASRPPPPSRAEALGRA
jgi:membrane dipeptidase